MSNALQLTRAALTAPPDLKGMFEVQAFKENFISNFEKTTGHANGAMIFERERILFMKAIAENKKLEQCDRFSIYAAFVELAVSGLTLNEGICYIIPYRDRAAFQIGWRGRLEQISQMPEINFVPEPQIVLTNELSDFDYELGENPMVIKHKPAKDRTITKENRIEFVYLVLDSKHGKRTFLMSRQEVLQIRDTYSIGYKYYMSQGGKYQDGKAMEVPFWLSNEAEAFKKTIVKRCYKYLPKTPRMKAIDEKIKTTPDYEDGTAEQTQDIDYGLDIAVDQSGIAGDNSKVNSGDSVKQIGESTNQSVSTNGAAGVESAEQKAKRTRRTKEQIAADEKAKSDKAAQEQANGPAETKTVTGPSGTKADAETAEVIPDGESDNPVDDLPSLDDLMNN